MTCKAVLMEISTAKLAVVNRKEAWRDVIETLKIWWLVILGIITLPSGRKLFSLYSILKTPDITLELVDLLSWHIWDFNPNWVSKLSIWIKKLQMEL